MSAAKLLRLAAFALLMVAAVWFLVSDEVRTSLLVFAAAAFVGEGLL